MADLPLKQEIPFDMLAFTEDECWTIVHAMSFKEDRYNYDKADIEVIKKILDGFPKLKEKLGYTIEGYQ